MNGLSWRDLLTIVSFIVGGIVGGLGLMVPVLRYFVASSVETAFLKAMNTIATTYATTDYVDKTKADLEKQIDLAGRIDDLGRRLLAARD